MTLKSSRHTNTLPIILSVISELHQHYQIYIELSFIKMSSEFSYIPEFRKIKGTYVVGLIQEQSQIINLQ